MVRSISLTKIVSPCLKPFSSDRNVGDGAFRRPEKLLWYKDLGQHAAGEFSMAVAQANNLLEDGSEIQSGPLSFGDRAVPNGTFVGVYDGHGGPETSRYICEHLFGNLKRFSSEQHGMSGDVIRQAFSATEEGFLSFVRSQWLINPQIAAVGSCCLVGVICGGILYIANAGDSRVVLGRFERGSTNISAVQLSVEHNARYESVRDELRSLHPHDSQIVVLKHKVWRVKGLLQEISSNIYNSLRSYRSNDTSATNLSKQLSHTQYPPVSRSIGDAYLKIPEFNKAPLFSRFRLSEPFCKSILSAEPSILTHKLSSQDQFLIFASDGLWDHLSNQEAVGIVQNNPRNGIARRLIKAALQRAAKKREMRYSDLNKIGRGIRRYFHDDITVIVLFLDPIMIGKNFNNTPVVSLKGRGVPV